MGINAYLIVESGSPYESGKKIPLTAGTMHIGRVWEDQKPDLAFEDGHISRNHAEIVYKDGHFELCDLPSSKHGTEVNGRLVNKGTPYTLKHNDKIVLARGAAVLRFCAQNDPGKTQDIEDLLPDETGYGAKLSPGEYLTVDIERREVLLGGRELVPRVTGYEFELLELLYRNRGKAVSHEEIVQWVWRDLRNRETITRQNVATLVHRLRDCLGDFGKYVVNIPAYGYRLD
jgi:hypothetical protein